jgi:hypothetical protein
MNAPAIRRGPRSSHEDSNQSAAYPAEQSRRRGAAKLSSLARGIGPGMPKDHHAESDDDNVAADAAGTRVYSNRMTVNE